MNVKNVNLRLLNVYEEWLRTCAQKLNDEKPKSKKYEGAYGYSAPFVTGLSQSFEDREKKKVLIFGQEARDWLSFETMGELKGIQENAIRFFDSNIFGDKELSSPFWKMMHSLNDSFSVCWSNLDKLHRVYEIDVKSQQLEYFEKEEKVLLSPLTNGKNIIQNEIEIIRPDIAVFVTGPNYRKATKYALGIPDFEERKNVPSINGEVILHLMNYYLEEGEFPILWTYHPNFMNYHNFDEHIENLKNKINELTQKT